MICVYKQFSFVCLTVPRVCINLRAVYVCVHSDQLCMCMVVLHVYCDLTIRMYVCVYIYMVICEHVCV